MNPSWPIILTICGLLLVAAIVLAVALRKPLRRRRHARARDSFPAVRPRVEQEFFEAASTSGMPRGLRWKECRFHEGQVFAVDKVSGALYALVGVTISFEAIEGGPMEDVEAVGNLRAATGVFEFRNRVWTTHGRTVFNLLPEETLQHYQRTLEPFDM